MRPESEILSLLVSTAENDPRIRAAYLEGSRVDPGAKKDLLRDYDVEFIVRETASFRSDREWIKRFGDILFMQYPEDGPEGEWDSPAQPPQQQKAHAPCQEHADMAAAPPRKLQSHIPRAPQDEEGAIFLPMQAKSPPGEYCQKILKKTEGIS